MSVRKVLKPIVVIAGLAHLTACVSVPRTEAGKLADAGISTTTALSTGFRDLATDFANIDVISAFSLTYEKCEISPVCEAFTKSPENLEEGQKLEAVINARAKAVDGLTNLYRALKTEADYDARQDLLGAVDDAYESVEAYTASVEALTGADILSRFFITVIGGVSDKRQRERILLANEKTKQTLLLYQAALRAESYYFDAILSDNVDTVRADVKVALFQSGLVNKTEIVLPLIEQMGLVPNSNLEKLNLSKSTKIAIDAYIQASSEYERARTKQKFSVAINALSALVAQHDKLSADQPLKLEDINRHIQELDYLVFGDTQSEGN